MCCISHYVVTYTTTRSRGKIRLGKFFHIPHVAIRNCDCLLCIHRDPVSWTGGGEVGLGRRRRDSYLLHVVMFPRLSTGTLCQTSVAGKWVSVDVEGTRIYCML